MADISAKLVKQLRDKTNAGIMACKKALVATSGDMDAAEKWLREKGMSDAAKKSDRETAEGTVAVSTSDDLKSGAILEIKCETDFVARNSDYSSFAAGLADKTVAQDNPTADTVTSSFEEDIKQAIAKFGENITIGQVGKLTTDTGMVQKYVHGVGNIGVLASFKTGKADTVKSDDFVAMTMGVVMHIAAMNPDFLNRDDVTEETLNEQKELLSKKAKESGKPDNVIEKMVNGQLNKFYSEICLLDQPYVKDQKKKVGDIIKDTAKKVGDEITLENFIRFQLGA
mgnify:CR=1 FL=1